MGSKAPSSSWPKKTDYTAVFKLQNEIFIFYKDSNWEQTNEPIELKPPSSIDDVIKPVQPNPYNAIISESTHSSNVSPPIFSPHQNDLKFQIAFISSKFDSYSSAVKYNPNQTHIQAESALVDSDDELTSEKLYSKLKCGTDSSRVTG